MADQTTVVVSDLHMDVWEESEGAEVAEAKRHRLQEFFDWILEVRPYRFVIAGDLLDVPERTEGSLVATCASTVQALYQMTRAGIKVGYVVGNHDCGLIGLAASLPSPPVRIDYPCMLIDCDGRTVLIEHGHLHDPWLWDYVRQHARDMWVREVRPPQVYHLQDAAPAPEEGPADEADLLGELHRSLQADREQRLADDEARAGLLEIMRTELETDYGDVMDAEARAQWQADRSRLLQGLKRVGGGEPGRLSVAPSDAADVEELGVELLRHLYVGPHWRRSARRRVEAFANAADPVEVSGVIMGHTHHADRADLGGFWYANVGTWRDDGGGIVVIKGGDVIFDPRRRWDDPWPEIS